MKFSVLDRAATTIHETPTQTLQSVAQHAQYVEHLGFERFLVAEHHSVPGIPGSQPAVLAANIAAQTSTIRVGTGGIMLPNHNPFLVAEQIGLLEALRPGRIDIGIGSSIGFTAPVRKALRQEDPHTVKARYEQDLTELISYLTGTAQVSAYPQDRGATPLYVLAGYRSAFSAAKLGLGIILGGPLKAQVKAAEVYRENFVPSALFDEPRVISSFNIAVADSEQQARDLLLPESYAKVMAQTTGSFPALIPAQEIELDKLTKRQLKQIETSRVLDLCGTPLQVRKTLAYYSEALGTKEFLVTGDMPDREGRARSEELLSQLFD